MHLSERETLRATGALHRFPAAARLDLLGVLENKNMVWMLPI